MKVVINGAGIAGTTLAYWLREFGHEVLLVEKSSQLRRGGYPLDILSRLTNGRFMALARTDLAATIYGALDGGVETIFGDSIAGIDHEGDYVRVSFDNAVQREFDLVIGADGLHSRVHRLVFGEETKYEFPLGCHFAAFEAEGYQPSDELSYVAHGAPGRYITRFSLRGDKMFFFLVFRDELLTRGISSNVPEYKSVLTEVFGDMGWECPQILAAMEYVDDIYFDSVSQIRINRWTTGRTALVGDAAACPSLLAGEGAGLAMAEAYVLAGEIHNGRCDHRAAFARYEEHMMPFLRRKHRRAAKLASLFVPRTAFGVAARNFTTRLLRLPGFPELLMGRYLHDGIKLHDFEI